MLWAAFCLVCSVGKPAICRQRLFRLVIYEMLRWSPVVQLAHVSVVTCTTMELHLCWIRCGRESLIFDSFQFDFKCQFWTELFQDTLQVCKQHIHKCKRDRIRPQSKTKHWVNIWQQWRGKIFPLTGRITFWFVFTFTKFTKFNNWSVSI